jgi:hypothetical protein
MTAALANDAQLSTAVLAEDRARAEIDKVLAESEKLKAEAAQMREKWWQRPSYWQSLLPIVTAVGALVAGWATGFFDARRAELAAHRDRLQTEVVTLRQEHGALTSDKARLLVDNKILGDEHQRLETDLKTMRGKLQAVRGNIQFVTYCDQQIENALAILSANASPEEIKTATQHIQLGRDHLRTYLEWLEDRTKFLEHQSPE